MKTKFDGLIVDEAYDFFLGTLANKTRIKILNELLVKDMNVSELTEAISVDQSTISNNIRRLKYCGFVTMRPEGKERIYSINHETVGPLMKLINEHTRKFCVNCIRRKKNE